MISRSTNIQRALLSRQRGFLLNPFRFGGSAPGDNDPYFSNVSLLLHMDGADNSTTFADNSSSARIVTKFGDAKISTAQSKFGGASALFDGTSDYLTIPANAAFAFGTADFTVELWFRPRIVSVYHALFYTGDYETNQLSLRVTNAGKLQSFVHNGTNAYGLVTGTTSLVAGEWYNILMSSSAGVIRTFLNGNLETSATNTTGIESSGAVYIGGQNVSNEVLLNPDGNIDELRVTKGVARKTSNFIPDEVPFPNS